MISMETNTLNYNLCPSSIQYERISFPASLASSAEQGKHMYVHVSSQKKQANELHFRAENSTCT